MTNIVYT